jgi:hypothetical protein
MAEPARDALDDGAIVARAPRDFGDRQLLPPLAPLDATALAAHGGLAPSEPRR